MYHQDSWRAEDARNRRDVAYEIEIEVVVKRRVPSVRRSNLQQRVTVRRSTHDSLGRDIAAGACPVLNDKGLTEVLRQPLADQARVQVGHAAGRPADDQSHWPRWIGLRPSSPQRGRQRGSACGQMQKLSAGKFHFEPPSSSHYSMTSSARQLWCLCVRAARQTHRKHRALARLARHGDVPAHHARELAREGKSETRAPKRCAVLASAWLNSSNSLACCSGVMPMPVSATASSIQSRPLATLRARSLTSPSLVNLQALLNRLSSICRSRMGSTVNAPRFSWASTTRRFLFCSASCPAVPMTSLISGASCTVCGLSSSFPASIFDRSSTWLMSPSR